MIPRALVALVLLVASAALANGSPTHQAWVSAAFARVPVSVADRSPERAALKANHSARFVAAIAKVSEKAPRSPREYAALLLVLGSAESNFDTDVVEGRCPPKMCDVTLVKGERVFRARGAFQSWRLSFVAELWDVAHGNPEAQVEMADRTLRRSMARCAPFVAYPASIWRAYSGRSCSFELKDEARRTALYLKLLSTPKPKGDAS